MQLAMYDFRHARAIYSISIWPLDNCPKQAWLACSKQACSTKAGHNIDSSRSKVAVDGTGPRHTHILFTECTAAGLAIGLAIGQQGSVSHMRAKVHSSNVPNNNSNYNMNGCNDALINHDHDKSQTFKDSCL